MAEFQRDCIVWRGGRQGVVYEVDGVRFNAPVVEQEGNVEVIAPDPQFFYPHGIVTDAVGVGGIEFDGPFGEDVPYFVHLDIVIVVVYRAFPEDGVVEKRTLAAIERVTRHTGAGPEARAVVEQEREGVSAFGYHCGKTDVNVVERPSVIVVASGEGEQYPRQKDGEGQENFFHTAVFMLLYIERCKNRKNAARKRRFFWNLILFNVDASVY